MRKNKIDNLIHIYNDEYINSISLKDIKSKKELHLLTKSLQKANDTITSFYQMLYNDFIMSINNDSEQFCNMPDIDLIKKYKLLAKKIQTIYNYVNYINTFDNPFKVRK